MAKFLGGVLRGLATFVYMIDFLCAAGILGIYSYFLAKLHSNGAAIIDQWRAVEGLSGAAVLYTIFAVFLTCFLAGLSFFSFMGMLFDLLFCGAMIAIAVLVREAAQKCTGTVTTPFGTGNVNTSVDGLRLATICKLNLAVLIIACVGAFFFLISFLLQVLILMNHKRDSYKGPSAENDYTEGPAKRKFFQRRAKTTKEVYQDGGELGVVGVTTNGTTMGHTNGYADNVNTKYESHAPVPTLPVIAPAVVVETTPTRTQTGPNIVSSTTTTREGYYDPYAAPPTTGPTGFVAPATEYRYDAPRQVDGSTNY